MKKIRLNNFINVYFIDNKIIIDTNNKIILVTDSLCIDLIKRIINKKVKVEFGYIKVEDKILKDKNFNLLLQENIFLDAEKNSIVEILMLFDFFINPNINNIQVTYEEALAITRKAHPKIVSRGKAKMPKGIRYSYRNFADKKVSLKIIKDVAEKSYGIIWQQKQEPFIIHTPVASAGAMYPLKMFFIIKNKSLYKVYFFNKEQGRLEKYCEISEMKFKKCLTTDLDQGCLDAPHFVLIASDISLICRKYGYRGLHYSILEGGALSHQLSEIMRKENIQSVHIGGYFEESIKKCLNFKKFPDVIPLLLIAFGYEK